VHLMRNSSNFFTYSCADLLPWVYRCHLSIRWALTDGGTYFPLSSSLILRQVSIGSYSKATCMFTKLVQYWLAWPINFIAVNLTFLSSVRSYHIKYLSSCWVQSRKSYGSWSPSNVCVFHWFAMWENLQNSRRITSNEKKFTIYKNFLLEFSGKVCRWKFGQCATTLLCWRCERSIFECYCLKIPSRLVLEIPWERKILRC